MPSPEGPPRRRAAKAKPAAKRGPAAPRVPPDPLEESSGAAPEAFNYWDQPAPERPPFDPNRTLGDWMSDLIPPQAQLHFLNAGREFALGVQVTLDHHSGRAQVQRRGSTRIDIE